MPNLTNFYVFNCITLEFIVTFLAGKNYALTSMKVTLAYLIRSFRFKANISELKVKIDIMMKPRAGHYMTIERRT